MPLPLYYKYLRQKQRKTFKTSCTKTLHLLFGNIHKRKLQMSKKWGNVEIVSTYLHANSTRISREANAAAREYITTFQYRRVCFQKCEKLKKGQRKSRYSRSDASCFRHQRTHWLYFERISFKDKFRLYRLSQSGDVLRKGQPEWLPQSTETTSVRWCKDQYFTVSAASKIC